MRSLFPLGQIAATPTAHSVLSAAGISWMSLLRRHQSGDWGVVDPSDSCENELGLRDGYRLMSVYPVGSETVWVITEADRSSTTILLPEDY